LYLSKIRTIVKCQEPLINKAPSEQSYGVQSEQNSDAIQAKPGCISDQRSDCVHLMQNIKLYYTQKSNSFSGHLTPKGLMHTQVVIKD